MNLFKRFFVKRKLYDGVVRNLAMNEDKTQKLLQDITDLKTERRSVIKELNRSDKENNVLHEQHCAMVKDLNEKIKEVVKLYGENQTTLKLLFEQSHVSDNIGKYVDVYWVVLSDYEIVRMHNYRVTLGYDGYCLVKIEPDNNILFKGTKEKCEEYVRRVKNNLNKGEDR